MNREPTAFEAKAQGEAGFTLIEMLVVLTIMALVAGFAMSRLSRRPAFVDRAELRTTLSAAVSGARRQALETGRAVPVQWTPPASDRLHFEPALGSPDRPLTTFPDGSSNGGTVSSDGRDILTIDWMTGRVGDAGR